jgi:dephospho-CoA kinase
MNSKLKGKSILVVGMAGTGKTYLSNFLTNQGVNAFDGDEVEGLSGWEDVHGSKIIPKDLTPRSLDGLEWNWDSDVIRKLKTENNGLVLFGVSSNWHKLLNLFDKVFFLYIDSSTTRERLMSSDRDNDYGKDSEQVEKIIKYIEGFKRFAIEHGAIELDASRSPEEIFENIISVL